MIIFIPRAHQLFAPFVYFGVSNSESFCNV